MKTDKRIKTHKDNPLNKLRKHSIHFEHNKEYTDMCEEVYKIISKLMKQNTELKKKNDELEKDLQTRRFGDTLNV